MSYPYPQDRHRDRREKGEQPYKDAKESLTQSSATIQAQEETFGADLRDKLAETENANRPSAETLSLMEQAGNEVRSAAEREQGDAVGETSTGGGEDGGGTGGHHETTPDELDDLRHSSGAIGRRGHDEPDVEEDEEH
ncbi:MAG: hypothetical protein AVDCRST_MAG49-1585 [uncultured Thermomicrobiales bacterium]|uniref:Uncharacterized protein n=1 Tax=uncultured Thermomicrobiales bacterium TaxID=1645740 RepID=A0A6J4UGD7_9BACT|nr:MAG: hypothetical protein AVDCRST_MAG49-1585 [uncultured Thermomicrobiales bacterium]